MRVSKNLKIKVYWFNVTYFVNAGVIFSTFFAIFSVEKEKGYNCHPHGIGMLQVVVSWRDNWNHVFVLINLNHNFYVNPSWNQVDPE